MAETLRLRRWDLLLMPLIAAITVTVMLAAAEVVARVAYETGDGDACLVADSKLGLRYTPNCNSETKSFESAWITNHYNACGYRSDAPCGPVPPGVRRVVLLGSSIALGYLVPEPDTYAYRSAADLTDRCAAPVEFQDLGGYLIFWTRVVNRVNDALSLKPAAALLQISTYDLERPDPGEGDAAGYKTMIPSDNLLVRLQGLVLSSRAWMVAQSFLFQNEKLYLGLYLRSGIKSSYLRQPLPPFWQGRLENFNVMLGGIADRFHAAGVPLALVFVPHKAQAELASRPDAWPEAHPYELNTHLAQIAAAHGVPFIDTTPAVSRAADVNALYYPFDGHLDPAGHHLVTKAIVDGMIADLAPFKDCQSGLKVQASRE